MNPALACGWVSGGQGAFGRDRAWKITVTTHHDTSMEWMQMCKGELEEMSLEI